LFHILCSSDTPEVEVGISDSIETVSVRFCIEHLFSLMTLKPQLSSFFSRNHRERHIPPTTVYTKLEPYFDDFHDIKALL